MNIVRWLWLIWAVAALALEGYAIWEGQGNTLSEVVWLMTKHYPLVAFLVGLIAGHWFWQRVGQNGNNGH